MSNCLNVNNIYFKYNVIKWRWQEMSVHSENKASDCMGIAGWHLPPPPPPLPHSTNGCSHFLRKNWCLSKLKDFPKKLLKRGVFQRYGVFFKSLLRNLKKWGIYVQCKTCTGLYVHVCIHVHVCFTSPKIKDLTRKNFEEGYRGSKLI